MVFRQISGPVGVSGQFPATAARASAPERLLIRSAMIGQDRVVSIVRDFPVPPRCQDATANESIFGARHLCVSVSAREKEQPAENRAQDKAYIQIDQIFSLRPGISPSNEHRQ